MSLLRRGASLLGALRRAQAGPEALGAQLQRFGSEASTSEPHVAQDWYMRQRQQIILGNRMPVVTASSWVAPNATLIGDTDLMDRVSVWFGAVLRGDLNNITVGAMSNIQDRTVVHAARSSPTGLTAATLIGKYVTVEPNCVLRSCRIQDNCIVGARSVLLEGSLMETNSILEPGSVLPPARRIPSGELWGGSPARFIRKLTADEKADIKAVAQDVYNIAAEHWANDLPHGTAWRDVEAWRAERIKRGELAWGNARAMRYYARKEAEEAHKLSQVR